MQDGVSKLLKSSKSFEDFFGSLQKLHPHVATDLSVIGEIHEIAHLLYDPKPDAIAKLFHDLNQQMNKLSPEQRKLLHLAFQFNDKQFAEWTKDRDLFQRMHSYPELVDLMVKRAELSVGLKHLAMNRGIATGKMCTSRDHSKVSV